MNVYAEVSKALVDPPAEPLTYPDLSEVEQLIDLAQEALPAFVKLFQFQRHLPTPTNQSEQVIKGIIQAAFENLGQKYAHIE